MKYISNRKIPELLESLKEDYQVYVPVKKGDQRFYQKYDVPVDNMVIGEVRAFEPLKSFFSRARELVAEGFSDTVPHSGEKPFAIVGAKACDLKGFKVQDHVFMDKDYEDAQYIKNREENLVISADCTCAIETCFCTALGDKPYPLENFDINLSEAGEGFIAEAGSEKGKALMEKYSSLFTDAEDSLVSERDSRREKVIEQVSVNIQENDVPSHDQYKDIIEKNYEASIWEEEAKTCVECGACTIICPTCHCFYLYDQMDKEKMARLRVWDSCMIKDYARVGGGENPRERLWMRLRNRFEKKFDFFPQVADIYACTGCGRCISACPARIDIRDVLKKLVENA